MGNFFMLLLSSADFFFQIKTFPKMTLSGTLIRELNCLDPDQDRHYVGPGLGPNCLQRLSAEDNSHLEQERATIKP